MEDSNKIYYASMSSAAGRASFELNRGFTPEDHDIIISKDYIEVRPKRGKYAEILLLCSLRNIPYDGKVHPFGYYEDYGSIDTTHYFYAIELFEKLQRPLRFSYKDMCFFDVQDFKEETKFYSSHYSFYISAKEFKVIRVSFGDKDLPKDPRVPTKVIQYKGENRLEYDEAAGHTSEIIVKTYRKDGTYDAFDWRTSGEKSDGFSDTKSLIITDDVDIKSRLYEDYIVLFITRKDKTAWPIQSSDS